MSIRKDKIIVVDIEATCWENYKAPAGQENEVIEIGVCLLDVASFQVSEKRSLLVRPINSEVSPFCTQLTTLTHDFLLRNGTTYGEACEILEKDYDSRNRLWASWGSFDYNIMWEQCKRRNVRYPFSKKHANLKRVFQQNRGNRLGLRVALESLGLTQVGTPHRGDDDAYNVAIVLTTLMQLHGRDILRPYGL